MSGSPDTRARTVAVLEERARLYARPMQTESSVPMLDVVCFELGTERFAIEAAVVQRIVPLPPVTALPGTLPPVAGIVNLRGGLIPVFDLTLLLEIPPAPASHLMVLGRDAFDFAVPIRAVSELVAIPVAPRDAAARGLVTRILPDGRALVDGATLLDDPRLVVAPAGKEPA
jgi:purine-binding chemotaxis protein CheW